MLVTILKLHKIMETGTSLFNKIQEQPDYYKYHLEGKKNEKMTIQQVVMIE